MNSLLHSLGTMTAVILIGSTLSYGTALAAPYEDPAAPAESIARMSEEKLQTAIERFVDNFYLAGEDLSTDEMMAIYAPVVNYFGNRRKKRASIIRDQLSYYRRWPSRSFELVPGTLSVVRSTKVDAIVNVTFEYFYETRSRKRTSRGRGVTNLTLDFTVPGGQIIREGGKVLERFR